MMSPTDAAQRSSHIAVEAAAACPFSMAEAYAADYLRAAELRGPESELQVPWLPLPFARHRVLLTFGIHTDLLDAGRSHDELHVTWRSGSGLLPDFHGTIRFRIDGERTRVLVDGSYVPPLGIAGRLFDLAIGRSIARASLQDLADRIAAFLVERETAWRAEHTVSA